MKKLFHQMEDNIIRILSALSMIALMAVGIVIVLFLFKDAYSMLLLVFKHGSAEHYYEMLEGILSFFIFFEFLTLIVTSLKNRGHVSVLFLLSLGITALIRVLLTYHDSMIGVVAIAAAILILVVAAILLKRFVFPEERADEHL